MKSFSRTRTVALAVLVVAASVCLPRFASAQSAKISIDRRLPPEIYAYVTVPSVPDLKKRFKASSYGKLLKDPAFQPFLKDIEVLIKKGSAEIEKKVGLKLDELLEIPSGEIAFAVAKSDRNVPTMAVFVDFGKHDAAVDKLLELGSKEATKAGLKRKEVTFKGTKIVTYAKPGDDANAKKKRDLAYFIKDSFFVFATNVEFLKSVVTRWDGNHASTFAKNDVYKYIKDRTRTGRVPVSTWYIDPLGLADAALFQNPDAPGGIKMASGFIKILGVDKLRALGGSVDMVVGDYESINKTVIYVKTPATGAFDLFKFPAVTQTPPKWVPATASSYTAMNWDLSKAYQGTAKIFNTFFGFGQPGAFEKKIDDFAKDPNGPKIHLKKDVIDNLTGRIHVAYDFTNPADAKSMRLMIALGVKDEKKVNGVMDKLAKFPAFPGKERKIAGVKVYELEFDGVPGLAGNTIFVGLIKNQLMLSNSDKLLEQVAKSGESSKSLADVAAYKRIAAKFPAKTSMVSFERGNTQLRAIYDQLRTGAFPLPTEGIDFTKLPPFSAVEKYLRSSGSFAVPDEHGVYMEGFSLRKTK